MLKGFKDFIMQGNVIDLAVAVVIGAAFKSIVDAFTTNVINPLIAAIGGSKDQPGLSFMLVDGNQATLMDFGAILTAIINFLLIAAVIYFVLVMPMNSMKAAAAKRKGVEAPASDNELLIEIRDLLAGRPLAHPADPTNPTGRS